MSTDKVKWMIGDGNLQVGYSFYGPFDNASKALEWADENCTDFQLLKLYAPSFEENG